MLFIICPATVSVYQPTMNQAFSLYPVLTHGDDESRKAANLNLMPTIE